MPDQFKTGEEAVRRACAIMVEVCDVSVPGMSRAEGESAVNKIIESMTEDEVTAFMLLVDSCKQIINAKLLGNFQVLHISKEEMAQLLGVPPRPMAPPPIGGMTS